jgi:sec-independent protein translocase protein TatA
MFGDSAQLFLGDPTQLLVILGVLAVVLIWGPSKIPELARAVGRARREFDDASRGLTTTATTSLDQPSPDPLVDTARRIGINTQGKTRQEISDEIVKASQAKN